MPAKIAQARRAARRIQEFITVFRESSYSGAQITAITRLINEGLNEREWSTLRRRFDLPDQARHSIGETISGYWEFRVDNFISRKLPNKIDDVAAYLNKLTDKLAGLRADPDFFKGVFAYHNPSPTEQAKTIDRALASLHEVQGLVDQARVRIKGPKNRPTHRGLFHGIAILDARMAKWGGQFTVDPWKIGYDVFHLADPMVDQPSFRRVLKDYLSALPEWDKTSRWVEHDHR